MAASSRQFFEVPYILKHSSGTTVKVGMTLVDSHSRLTSYARRYELEGFSRYRDFQVPADAARAVEKAAHKALKKYRLSGIDSAREIFSCGAKVAERAVEQAIAENHRVQEYERTKQEEQQKKRALEAAFEEAFKNSEAYEIYNAEMATADRLLNRKIQLHEVQGLFSRNINNPRFILGIIAGAVLIAAAIGSVTSPGFGFFFLVMCSIFVWSFADSDSDIQRRVYELRASDKKKADQRVSEAKRFKEEFREKFFKRHGF